MRGRLLARAIVRCPKTNFEITFAIQTKADSVADRITYVGGPREDGSRWMIEQQTVIRAIESGTWRFFVTHEGWPVDVVITQSPTGQKHLTALAGGVNPLLGLPSSPATPDRSIEKVISKHNVSN